MSDAPLFRDETPFNNDPELDSRPAKRAKRAKYFSSSPDPDELASPTRQLPPCGSSKDLGQVQDGPLHARQIETLDLLDDDTPQPRSPSKPPPPPRLERNPSWDVKYFGDVVVKGYALASASTFVKLKTGDPIIVVRVKPSAVSVTEGKKSVSAQKKLENDVVR